MLLAFIYSIIVLIVLGFLYKKMIDWEYPRKISKAQAIIPILLGILSLPLSFVFFLFIANIGRDVLGVSLGNGPLLWASFTSALFSAAIIALILRVLTVTVHMLLGFAMGRHLGLARYNKVTGKGSVLREYLLAYFVPVAVHTIYDTLAVNDLLSSKDEMTSFIGVAMALVALVCTFALQVYVFKSLRKNAQALAALSVLPEEDTVNEEMN